MRIVVTGASGFIGGSVLRALIGRDVEVIPVSRRRLNQGGHQVVVPNYDQTPEGDVLIHLAESNNQSSTEYLGNDYVSQATRLLDILLSKRFGRVVYASSAVVYDTGNSNPQKTEVAIAPSNIYALTKFECERRVRQSNGVVARIANVYGPGMSTENVVSRILEQLPNGNVVHVMDDNPVRDFIWIDDVARGLVDMALGEKIGVFNLGTGVGTSISELARLSFGLAGSAGRRLIPSNPTCNINARILDITGTELAFRWRPEVSLEQGLGKLITGNHAS